MSGTINDRIAQVIAAQNITRTKFAEASGRRSSTSRAACRRPRRATFAGTSCSRWPTSRRSSGLSWPTL